MPKAVSIIIPTYNRAGYLQESIESVIECLDGIDGEIIVVDDGSTDDTGKIVTNLKNNYKNLIYRQITHTGKPGMARNHGLENATGEFIAFQDSDDVWVKGKLQKQLDVFNNRNKDTVLVYGNISYIDGHGKSKSGPVIEPGKGLSGYLFDELLSVHRQPVPTSTVLIRRSAIKKAGKFNEQLPLATDMEYWIRLSTLGKFEFIDEVLTLVRRHTSNISTISEDIEGTFFDRLSQIPLYRSVMNSELLSSEQVEKLKWAQVEVADQLKKLSKRYAHWLVKKYRGPNKFQLVLNRQVRLMKDAVADFIYFLKNL